MADIVLTPGLTFLEAYRVARQADMHLISDGYEVKISPFIPPGWRKIPIRVKVTSPDRGNVCTTDLAVA